MQIKDLQNKLVGVLGFGQEGRATANYLLKHGIKPVLFDQRPWQEWERQDQDFIKSLGVNFIFGPDAFKELAGFNVAFRSPGIKLSAINDVVARFIEPQGLINQATTLITSQTKFFFEHCPAKIIGVTGTKGKGTTASLIYEILSVSLRGAPSSGINRRSDEAILSEERLLRSDALPRNDTTGVYLTGNIGKIQPLDILDNLNSDDWIVYELSSFQLQDLNLSPHIAVVLMTTSEHLDYHKNQNEYIEAKSAITKFQAADDFAIYNIDYPASVKIGEMGKGEKNQISTKRQLEKGCFIENDSLVVKNLSGRNFQFSLLRSSSAKATADKQGFGGQAISNFQLPGKHNLENICAAVAVGAILGIDERTIQTAAENFKGLEHRLEFVAEKNGVKFYNDSFSTTPETAIAAIESFSQPEIVILGGSSKNSDFTDLAKTIVNAANIKALILVGQEAGRIKQAIDELSGFRGKIMEGAENMEEIFAQIKPLSQAGNIVLLSPAAASFGMFKNYKDRGEQFRKAAEKL